MQSSQQQFPVAPKQTIAEPAVNLPIKSMANMHQSKRMPSGLTKVAGAVENANDSTNHSVEK